ncbi:pyridoxine 5'-phosphate synthase [Andreprevotia lacus DSM 23236]|jgi:pyridoxine 5-phosphate synthase|uniref:Pyridoxine 5'-phosphate synthase n=1 Tax=Andreprevotia lacus DSM 23236 TaxID=1121001 RepID=A0A1W1XLE3_9NEIS|nr:pyridoxine 5'-phosphate synthase [Andreprevotia lacus]SMC24361.1 pyridoxine 5'-phosphate synthase [Andreprevotia lacus DSM 23236]
MPTQLSVNLNKIALIRNSRGRDYPSISHFAHLALKAGAAGVTIHPRPDQRHARYSDVAALKEVVAQYPGTELNIEGYPDRAFLDVVLAARPHQCTLVPDEPGQITSDHGWNIARDLDKLKPIVAELKAAGIRVSLFVDPDPMQIVLAPATGCDRIELYTESFAHQHEQDDFTAEFARFAEAAAAASAAGLGINAGHDLNLDNLADFLVIPDILEVSIGHALTVEALHYGYTETVQRYVAILKAAG